MTRLACGGKKTPGRSGRRQARKYTRNRAFRAYRDADDGKEAMRQSGSKTAFANTLPSPVEDYVDSENCSPVPRKGVYTTRPDVP